MESLKATVQKQEKLVENVTLLARLPDRGEQV
jgi:hypothetical protein